MTAHDDVLRELRGLRHAAAHRPIDFKDCPSLVWHTGRGNVDVTVRFLGALLDYDDLDVLAALASLGFDNHHQNVEDRMNAFIQMHEDELKKRARKSADGRVKTIEHSRTVRRWADKGFEKIAKLVLEWSEEEANDRPLVELLLYQSAPAQIQLVVTCSGPPGIKMFRPTVIAGTGWVDLEPVPEQAIGFNPDAFRQGGFTIDVTSGTAVPGRIEVAWLGSTRANYEVQVHPSIRKQVVTSLVTKKGCEVSLTTIHGAALPADGSQSGFSRA